MIVVMKKSASREEIQHMIERVEALGLKAHAIIGTERTVIAAIGEKRDKHRQSLESGPGVAEVVPILGLTRLPAARSRRSRRSSASAVSRSATPTWA